MSTGRREQQEHFVAMLSNCWEAARLAGLAFAVELEDGSRVEGVPTEHAAAGAADAEFDHSGTRECLELGDTIVAAAEVRSYTVTRPGT